MDTDSPTMKFFFSFIPQIAGIFTCINFYVLNLHGEDIPNHLTYIHNGYSILEGYIFIFVTTIIFALLGLYLDNVLPGIGGVRRPWYYCLTSEYWQPNKNREEESNEAKAKILETQDSNTPLFEEVGLDLRYQETSGECLSIKGLSKEFDGKLVVDNLNLNIYKGQVFILLGHNGAGKTTTLSMLTGLLSATSGEATLQGTDIIRNNLKLKEILGICPQESVFYDKLTVEEHLKVFSAFKGINYEEQRSSLTDIISQLELQGSFNAKGEVLSGGQKRKLSILLSILGNPTILMLDEPTSSLDAEVRKNIWEIIKQRKKDSIIIMTTHYMDEAEQVGDRIAIMSKGELRCCGSALFLKKQFHTGYMLTLVKGAGFGRELVSGVVSKHSPEYRIASENQAEIVYNIPFEHSYNFPSLFDELDGSASQLGISSYGVAITSLEDVYLKVGRDTELEESKGVKEDLIELNAINERLATEAKLGEVAATYSISITKEHSALRNIKVTFIKTWKETLRTLRLFTLEILIPVLMFLIIFLAIPTIGLHSHTYSPSMFPVPNILPINFQKHNGKPIEELLRYLPKGYNHHHINVEKNKYIDERLKEFDLKTFNKYKDERAFGAIYIEEFSETSIQAAIFGNVKWPHAPLIFSNILTNAFLRYAINDQITVTQHIEPMKFYSENEVDLYSYTGNVLIIIYVGIGITMAISSIGYSLVKQRKEFVKFQQVIHGLNLKEFWIGRFAADFTKLLIPIFSIFILKTIFEHDVSVLIT